MCVCMYIHMKPYILHIVLITSYLTHHLQLMKPLMCFAVFTHTMAAKQYCILYRDELMTFASDISLDSQLLNFWKKLS